MTGGNGRGEMSGGGGEMSCSRNASCHIELQESEVGLDNVRIWKRTRVDLERRSGQLEYQFREY